MDQLIWRPIIAWAEKFKFEQVEAAELIVETPNGQVAIPFADLQEIKLIPKPA